MDTALLGRIYQRILRESAPDWGDVAFDPERKSPVKDPPEPDTPDEQDFIRAFEDYVVHNELPTQSFAKRIRDALESGAYPDALVPPPPSAELYRGMIMQGDQLERWLGGPTGPLEGGMTETRGSWTVRSMASSWTPVGAGVMSFTYDKKVAYDFARMASLAQRHDPFSASVVMVARAGDNPGVFMDVRKLIDIIGNTTSGRLYNFGFEAEVLAVGPVKVHTLEWGRLVRT